MNGPRALRAPLAPLLLAVIVTTGRWALAQPIPEPPASVELAVDSSRANTVVERRVSTTSQWQTALGLPVYSWGETWEHACVAPCVVRVDPHSAYRIGGEVAPSSTFLLPQGSDALKLHVRAGSSFAYVLGTVMSGVGTAALVGGGVAIFAAPRLSDVGSESAVRSLGWALIGTGAVLIAVGIPLWLGDTSTVVTDDGRRIARTRRVGWFSW